MLPRFLTILLPAFIVLTAIKSAHAGGMPTQIGECVETRVRAVGTRLENVPGSGSLITFANGGQQVSYKQIPQVDQSRAGDVVMMCLVYIPRNCPPGDYRGRRYRTTNSRTAQTWTLPDAEHMCGGA